VHPGLLRIPLGSLHHTHQPGIMSADSDIMFKMYSFCFCVQPKGFLI
jgi:hypothetical protein